MKQIVCLSHTPWSSHPTRTQQLMTRLSGADVLFFEPPGPRPDGKGRKVRPNIMVYQLPRMVDPAENRLLHREGHGPPPFPGTSALVHHP